MTLLVADRLDPRKFFRDGSEPIKQGSSFDLTIGGIYDDEGRRVDEPFVLKPNHMVQVVSAEVFNLPSSITGHVTYKTTLTSNGIWALTVGIVDPGWDGPISTTLLNFSKINAVLSVGDAFLRVSFFEHAPVSTSHLRKAPEDYLKGVKRAAATILPKTFLDKEKIEHEAGRAAIAQLRNQALIWVAFMGFLFAGIQALAPSIQSWLPQPRTEVSKFQDEIEKMRKRLSELEHGQTSQKLSGDR